MRGSPGQIALVLRRRTQALERAVREAEAASAAEALEIARDLSSGSRSTSQLRAMGHPYRRGGPGPALPINAQSGRFADSWRVAGPRKAGGGLKTTLGNRAPHARMLERGTARMMPRPIVSEIRRRAKAARAKRHRAALKAVHQGG